MCAKKKAGREKRPRLSSEFHHEEKKKKDKDKEKRKASAVVEAVD